MIRMIEITDFHAPELDIFARKTEAQLLNKDHPEEGMFIAESPKVIERALNAGYTPVAVLVEKSRLKVRQPLFLHDAMRFRFIQQNLMCWHN